MSWELVDDRFHCHRKVAALRESEHYPHALAVWVLSLSWCGAQDAERWTGHVTHDVVAAFGIPDWPAGVIELVRVGLWDDGPNGGWTFHDWDTWNGAGGRADRDREQNAQRQRAKRWKDCREGRHDRHCPTTTPDGEPWTCPARATRAGRVTAGHVTPGRAGSGRAGPREVNPAGKGTTPRMPARASDDHGAP